MTTFCWTISVAKFHHTLKTGLIVALFFVVTACNSERTSTTLSGATMGTTYHVTVIDLDDAESANVKASIDDLLLQINQSMSTYIPDSELSLINDVPGPSEHQISPQLARVITEAISIGSIVPEYYDISVLPLVELWGFGAGKSDKMVPSESSILVALSNVGWNKFALNGNTLSRYADVQIDLSSIAKGYAVDAVGELLTSLGYSHYLVEIGGEITTSGRNSRGKLWRVGIEQPSISGGPPVRAVPLDNLAVATSGDYRNFFVEGEKRYGHTISPITGYPVSNDSLSVTVIGPTCAYADGWATALNASGPREGLRVANEQGIAALFIFADGDELRIMESHAYSEYLENL
jgi:thiamine biosynthesis lipoprotein